MMFHVDSKNRTMTCRAVCVLTSAQLHCMPPTTAAYAERVERYLNSFGIPATVSRNNGEISVERGTLEVKVGTDETRYGWQHVMSADDLKSTPLRIHPESVVGKLLALDDAADKIFGEEGRAPIPLAQFRDRSSWLKPEPTDEDRRLFDGKKD